MGLPERIGRYRVLGLVGQGAMGTVYRGRDESLDRDVALKVMSGHGADAESRARFQREARAAGRLQHPNIVTIYELGEHEGSPFMAMELLEGVDLQRAIEAGLRPDPKVTLPVVLQLLSGLGHAHENGIVHRDVKPSNIFLPRGRPVKIMDFGVARLAGTLATGAGMTTTGMVVGTPNYMSPEQVQAGRLDGRSDLFSAGLILYELVTGEKAYRADSLVALLFKIVHEEPDLGLLPGEAEWERLRCVVKTALARDPERRYPDARAMAAELEQALLDLGGSPNWAAASDAGLLVKTVPRPHAPALPPTETPAPPPAPLAGVAGTFRRRAVPIAVGLAAASAVVVGLALYTAGRRPPATDAVTSNAPSAAPAASAPAVTTPARPAPLARAAPAREPAPPARGAAPPPPAPAKPGPPPTAAPPAAAPAGETAVEATPPEPADARLDRAESLFDKRQYAAALAEARAILKREPGNQRAKELAEDAEVEVVVDTRIREATAALKGGDKDAALEAIKKGLVVKPTDARLLELWKEATQD